MSSKWKQAIADYGGAVSFDLTAQVYKREDGSHDVYYEGDHVVDGADGASVDLTLAAFGVDGEFVPYSGKPVVRKDEQDGK